MENPEPTASSVAIAVPINSAGFLPIVLLSLAYTVLPRSSKNVKTDIRSSIIRAGCALPVPPSVETMENAYGKFEV